MSPSAIERMTICPASFAASQGVPEVSKLDSSTGTAAHEIHEQCLTHGVKAEQFKGHVIVVQEPDRNWEIPVDDEMVFHVQESVDRCNELPGLQFVEVRVDISQFTPLPDQSGSSDFFAIDEATSTIYVVDLKYGKGVRVNAYLNPQLVYYALGVLYGPASVFDIKRVVIVVHQPRLDNWDRWETTPAELIALGQHYKRLLSRCLKPNAPFHPDPKACKFCRAKPQCKARAEHMHRMAAGMFDDLDEDIESFETPWPETLPSADLMTVEQMVVVQQHAGLMRDFLDSVNSRLLHMLLHSQAVPGLKVVEGRSRRKYRDATAERQAAAHLIASGVAPSQVLSVVTASPSQAERLLAKEARKEFGDLFVVKPPGRPVIADEQDRRPVYNLTVAAQFDDLADEDEDSSN